MKQKTLSFQTFRVCLSLTLGAPLAAIPMAAYVILLVPRIAEKTILVAALGTIALMASFIVGIGSSVWTYRKLCGDDTNSKPTYITFIAFAIFFITMAVCVIFVRPLITYLFPLFPSKTLNRLLVLTIPYFITGIYVMRTGGFHPRIPFTRATLLTCLSGAVMAWILVVVGVFTFGHLPTQPQGMHDASPFDYYLDMFLIGLFGPFIEESFFRGTLFEILSRHQTIPRALLWSSALFTLAHIWNGFNVNLVFTFVASIVFTIMYVAGGLVPSVVVHAFMNMYVVYVISVST